MSRYLIHIAALLMGILNVVIYYTSSDPQLYSLIIGWFASVVGAFGIVVTYATEDLY